MSHILAFFTLSIGLLVQTFVIYPLESQLRLDEYAHLASLMYIPHGIKIVLVMMLGPVVGPVIFLAQFVHATYYIGNVLDSFWTSFFGAFAVVIPTLMLNASLKRPTFSAPVFYREIDISIIWTYASLAVISSLFNGLLHAIYFGINDLFLQYLYFCGDVSGSILVFILLLGVVRPIINHFSAYKSK